MLNQRSTKTLTHHPPTPPSPHQSATTRHLRLGPVQTTPQTDPRSPCAAARRHPAYDRPRREYTRQTRFVDAKSLCVRNGSVVLDRPDLGRFYVHPFITWLLLAQGPGLGPRPATRIRRMRPAPIPTSLPRSRRRRRTQQMDPRTVLPRRRAPTSIPRNRTRSKRRPPRRQCLSSSMSLGYR